VRVGKFLAAAAMQVITFDAPALGGHWEDPDIASASTVGSVKKKSHSQGGIFHARKSRIDGGGCDHHRMKVAVWVPHWHRQQFFGLGWIKFRGIEMQRPDGIVKCDGVDFSTK